MGKCRFAVVLITVLCTVLVFTLAACSRDGSVGNETEDPHNNVARYTAYDTVAVHDPSIVLAYEDAEGNTYPDVNAQEGLKKVYFVFSRIISATPKNFMRSSERPPHIPRSTSIRYSATRGRPTSFTTGRKVSGRCIFRSTEAI